MPKNSFLIEDILESSNSKPEFRGFKKRALSQHQPDCGKSSPSLSPASFVSSTSSSSLSDDFISSNDSDQMKHQYLKQALPSIFLSQYLNPMQNLLQSYPAKSDDSLALLTTYYTQLLATRRSVGGIENEVNHKIKRTKLEDDKLKTQESENVSPLDALLNLANNINKTNMNQQEPKIVQAEIFESKKHSNSSNSSFDGSVSDSLSNPIAKPVQSNSSLKRKRKNRTAFTANQIFELEKRFSTQKYLSPHDRDLIAYELQLTTAQVITWFQNRRAKQKRDLEELKNDVNAAKTLKVIDPDLDVDKIIVKSSGSFSDDRIKSSDSDDCGANGDDEELDVDDYEDQLNVENCSNLSNSMTSNNQNEDDSGSNSSISK